MGQEELSQNKPFSYKIQKNEKIVVFYQGRQVAIYKGQKASQLKGKLEGLSEDETQLALAKITGNFKRGNEKFIKNKK